MNIIKIFGLTTVVSNNAAVILLSPLWNPTWARQQYTIQVIANQYEFQQDAISTPDQILALHLTNGFWKNANCPIVTCKDPWVWTLSLIWTFKDLGLWSHNLSLWPWIWMLCCRINWNLVWPHLLLSNLLIVHSVSFSFNLQIGFTIVTYWKTCRSFIKPYKKSTIIKTQSQSKHE